jgi:hypothetical protein
MDNYTAYLFGYQVAVDRTFNLVDITRLSADAAAAYIRGAMDGLDARRAQG